MGTEVTKQEAVLKILTSNLPEKYLNMKMKVRLKIFHQKTGPIIS